jgi:response regulator RpfG family c-di-GMP phosphodiesterase
LLGDKFDILVVDDEPEVAECLSEVISSEQFACTSANSGAEAEDLLRRRRFAVVLTDMLMPDMDGLELLDRAKQLRPDARGILMSGRMNGRMARSALHRGAFDVIPKPFDIEHVRAVIAEACRTPAGCPRRMRTENADADTNPPPGEATRAAAGRQCPACNAGLVSMLTACLEAKDAYTSTHSASTAYYAGVLGEALSLSRDELSVLRAAALVHDIGKIGIPDAILDKPGKLAVDEFALVRQHPRIGYEILRHARCLQPILPAVLHHHEWWNGAGYPDGLQGENIPMPARIIHVADAIDAMFSRRSYRHRYPLERVVEELETGAGTQFDPRIAKTAVDWLTGNQDLILTRENRELLLSVSRPRAIDGSSELHTPVLHPSEWAWSSPHAVSLDTPCPADMSANG